MARTLIPAQSVAQNAGLPIVWTAVDQANGMFFINDGETVIMARNTDASPHAVTIDSVADQFGRVGDIVMTPVAESGVLDGIAVSSRLPTHLFNQAGTNNCNVDFASATGMWVAAISIAPRR